MLNEPACALVEKAGARPIMKVANPSSRATRMRFLVMFKFVSLFFMILSFPFIGIRREKGDQSDHLNCDFFGDAFGVQELFGLGSV